MLNLKLYEYQTIQQFREKKNPWKNPFFEVVEEPVRIDWRFWFVIVFVSIGIGHTVFHIINLIRWLLA